jgi:iron-sulfur cluster assembly protein
MLVLTEAAAQAVRSLIPAQQASTGGGLRISSAVAQPQEPSALQVTTAPGPGQADQVIEAAGARVFIEPQASMYLADKVLDAETDAQGKARFSLGVQDNGAA